MSEQELLFEGLDPYARHDEDFYATPPWQTAALLERISIGHGHGRVVEPCAGDGAIVRVLPEYADVLTNDIVQRDPLVPDFLLDARRLETWHAFQRAGRVSVVITNPPFNDAFEIAQHAVSVAEDGVALLLRLSWLEPTQKKPQAIAPEDRGPWLAAHPPTGLIVLPRYDYRHNGDTDSVTSAWVLWSKTAWFMPGRHIEVVTKIERDELAARYGKR